MSDENFRKSTKLPQLIALAKPSSMILRPAQGSIVDLMFPFEGCKELLQQVRLCDVRHATRQGERLSCSLR
jgi:hypothetical protein